MRARVVRFWSHIHTWTSLVSMVFLLMLCLTGLPLIFHHEIDELFEQEVTAPVLPADTPPAPLDRVMAAAQLRYPGTFVLFLNWSQDHPNVVTVAVSPVAVPTAGQFRRVMIDARTTTVLGEEEPRRGVMDVVLTLHKNMFAGLPGELFLGAMGVVFALSVVSGVVVYGPFMRRLDFGTVRRTSSKRTKWLDLHNLLGVVTVTWALVVCLTGTINTLAVPLFDLWRAQVLPGLLAPHHGKPVARPSSVDAAVTRVREARPDSLITSVVMPTPARFGSPQHFVVWTKGRSPFTARLFTPVLVEADSGAMIEAPAMPWYLRTLQVSRPLHFGDYGGLPLKILWAILDVITIMLLASGIYLWLARRWRPRMAEREGKADAARPAARPATASAKVGWPFAGSRRGP